MSETISTPETITTPELPILPPPKLESSSELKPTVELQSVIVSIPTGPNLDELSTESLATLVEKYLDDGVIDNDELVDIVKCVMEIVEKKKEIQGEDKKKLALIILKKFINDKVKDYDNLEKLFDKAIDLAVKVSKDGLETIKLNSDTISQSKEAFNIIYNSALSKVNEQYPLADDIINNIFDIALYVMKIIEGQTSLTENEKKILLKKIITKIINSLESKFTIEQKSFLISQIEPTINLVQIGIRAQNGQFEINPVEVVGFLSCIMAWFRKCCSRSSQK